jgi:hypothetical protein
MPGLGQSNGKFNSLTVDGATTLKGPVTFDMDSEGTPIVDTPIVVFEGDEDDENSSNGIGSLFVVRPFNATNDNTQLMLGRDTHPFRTIRHYGMRHDTSVLDVIKTRVHSTGLNVYGTLSVSGNTTLGTQDTGNETHINGSLVVDMDRGLDGVDDHPQLRIHAANGEVGPMSNPDGTVAPASWTTARVIVDKGPNNHHGILDIGNVDREWYYLNLHSQSRVDMFINRSGGGSGAQPRLRIMAAETLVNNDLKVSGNTTLGNSTSDTITFAGIPKLPVFTTLPNTGTLGQMIIYQQNDGTQYLKVWIRTGIGLNSGGGFNSAESWMTVTLT